MRQPRMAATGTQGDEGQRQNRCAQEGKEGQPRMAETGTRKDGGERRQPRTAATRTRREEGRDEGRNEKGMRKMECG